MMDSPESGLRGRDDGTSTKKILFSLCNRYAVSSIFGELHKVSDISGFQAILSVCCSLSIITWTILSPAEWRG